MICEILCSVAQVEASNFLFLNCLLLYLGFENYSFPLKSIQIVELYVINFNRILVYYVYSHSIRASVSTFYMCLSDEACMCFAFSHL